MKTRGVDSVYSWVVAVSAGCLYLIATLPLRLGSMLFVEMIDRYDTNRRAASLPFALATFMRSASGPLVGYLGNKIGLQEVIMLGCIFCSVGMGTCYFAEHIIVIDLCFGLIYGLGFGFSTSLVPEIINQHFLKHRTKGYGVVLGSCGFLNFVIPPILESIMDTYGVSGSLLVMSGIILNSVPAAMLLIKPDDRTIKGGPLMHDQFSLSNEKKDNLTALKEESDLVSLTGQEVMLKPAVQDQPSLEISKVESSVADKARRDILSTTSKVKHSELIPPNILNQEKHYDSILDESNQSEYYFDSLKKRRESSEKDLNAVEIQFSDEELKRTSALPFSTKTMSESNKKLSHKSKFNSIDILWSPIFLLSTFIQSAHFYIMYVSWTVTVDLVRDKGISKSLEVYFVMAMALCDTVGRLSMGFVTDSGYMSVENFSSLCYAVLGLSCLLLAWISGFLMTLVIICIFGLIIGINTTQLPGLMTKFIEKEKRTMAMASRLIMYAPMSFTMSPLIGYFRGTLGSYDGLLYVIASICLACCIGTKLLPKLKHL